MLLKLKELFDVRIQWFNNCETNVMIAKFLAIFFNFKNFEHLQNHFGKDALTGRDVVRSLTLAYAKRPFPDSNP